MKYQTPDWVVSYMVSMIPEGVVTVLEPTPGNGNIVRQLEGKYQVTAPEDYFSLDKDSAFDCVVMNPPFSSKYANMGNAPHHRDYRGMKLGYHILVDSLGLSNHVIALMPWFTISDSDVRLQYLMEWGLKSITVLPRKTFNYARIQTCVLELCKNHREATRFRFLRSKNERLF